jgi:origin recognition complex subunit 4
MSARSVTRKRSRAQFNEEDELVSESNKTPLSNTKRKKANVSTSTPGSGTVFGSIKKKFGGIPGFPEPSKENATLEDDEDELASIEVYTPRMKRAEKDIYDVPSSPEEERRIVQRNGGADRMEHAPSLKKLTPALVQGSTSQNRKGKPSGDMYDFPDGDSTPRQGRKSASSVERAKAHLAPIAQASSTEVPKRGRGRPRKSEILKQAKQLSNKAMREKMMAVTEADSEDVGESGTPRLDSRRPKRKEDSEDPALQSDATIVVQSTVKLTAAARELKSALTPIKRNRGRPRKSVAFEEAEEVAFGFKDIPASASAQKASKYRLGAIASENVPDSKGLSKPEVELDLQSASDEDGEEACARCSGVDFEDANPIILCDNCDYGIHLKCSKLRKVPKGSWLCPNCTPKPKADDLYCRICSRPDSTKKNQIILCETCDYGIHLDCSDMKEIPEEEWYCPECKPEPEKDLDIPFGVTSKVSSRCPKITGQRRMKLMGYEDEMQKVYQVVEQTILAGEGNSMLVIGARGCGKTTVSWHYESPLIF